MHLYLVRHGETELGGKLVHQPPTTPLSERGREESYLRAERMRVLTPDIVLTSDYTRALETARIIGLRAGVAPTVAGLFREVVAPSSLFGASHFSPRTFWYVLLSTLFRRNPSWRYGDAENYADLSDRVRRTETYLRALAEKYETVVAVSHSMYITVMISYLTKKRMLDARDLILTLLHVKRIKNGDIVHLTYDEKTEAWELAEAPMSA